PARCGACTQDGAAALTNSGAYARPRLARASAGHCPRESRQTLPLRLHRRSFAGVSGSAMRIHRSGSSPARWLPLMSAARNGVSPQFVEPTCAISLQRGRVSMRLSSRRHVLGVTASLVIAALSPAIAQEQSHAAKGRETSLISTVRTGKERLGRKWMDEQRI